MLYLISQILCQFYFSSIFKTVHLPLIDSLNRQINRSNTNIEISHYRKMQSQNINQQYLQHTRNWNSYLQAKYNHQSMPSLLRITNSHKYQWDAQAIKRLKQSMKRDNNTNEQLGSGLSEKPMRKKFILSPLMMRGDKPVGNNQQFKLKSYLIKPLNDYDNPPQDEQEEQQNGQQQGKNQFNCSANNNSLKTKNNNINDSISQLMNTTSQFSHFNSTFSKQFKNKQNLSYQDEVSQMLLTKSKFIYEPKNRIQIKNILSKKSFNLFQPDELSCIGGGNRICSISKLPMELNKTKSQFSFRTIVTDKASLIKGNNIEPLNGTRTKLLSKLNHQPKNNLSKADLFPLQRLLQKKKRKVNFRNKWFNQSSTIES